MMVYGYMLAVCTVLGLHGIVSCIGYGQFSGGTMSYDVILDAKTGHHLVRVDLITNWVLGQGPCGPSCSKSDIGKDTMKERNAIETAKHDPVYFGNWTIEDASTGNILMRYADKIRRNATEKVIAVSKVDNWEQEWMKVTLEMTSSSDKVDIVFEGCCWQELPLQTNPRFMHANVWHIQSKVDLRSRSDTGKPNAPPKAFVKPMYRVLLDSVTQITIPANDTDDDIVKCKLSLHVEAGLLSNHLLPGLSVDENCAITINASSALGYKHDLLGGIAVTVRDYNKEEITLGGKRQLPNQFAIGGSTVQFLIHVLKDVNEPVFISPTLPRNHEFYLYAGSTLNLQFFARSPENTSIDHFEVFGTRNEALNISELLDDKSGRERVKGVMASWNPGTDDKGRHIICGRVLDNMEMDASVDRCFTVEVTDKSFHSTTVSSVKPYFVDLPYDNQTITCTVGITCVLPVYVKSTSKIVDIDVETLLKVTKPGEITQLIHNGEVVYRMDLSFTNIRLGLESVCLTATDENGISSERVCKQYEVVPVDPCLSGPCLNSGKCSVSAFNSSDYVCKCLNDVNFEGKNCDLKVFHDCDSNPCAHGRCIQRRTGGFACSCRGTGYTGRTCSIRPCLQSDNKCTNGYCHEENRTVTCMCPIGFYGDKCDHSIPDTFPNPYINGARFTDTAMPQSVTCPRNTACSVALVSSGTFINLDRPNITAGYVHPTLDVIDLHTERIVSGSFLSSLIVKGSETGIYDMCIQILNENGVNEDGICIKVNVTEDRSNHWSDMDKPHFLLPSLPTNTNVTCLGSYPCHILLFASPGLKARTNECVHLVSNRHHLSHVSSTCDSCDSVKDTNNCTFDLVMFPEQETEVCLTAYVSGSHASGEKRCYTITVDKTPLQSGCQVLHCKNGGFCDGHDEQAVCHCPVGYTGSDCGTETASVYKLNGLRSFIGVTGIPQIARCFINSTCIIPFAALGSSFTIRLGYVSPELNVTALTTSFDTSTEIHRGLVTIIPLSGQGQFCLQIIHASTVADEMCTDVLASGGPESSPSKKNPYFVQPTLPAHSTIFCEAHHQCSFELHFTPGTLFNSSELCPVVTDVSADVGHKVHIFPSTHQSDTCATDISFIPPTSVSDGYETMCFELSLPSVIKRGETRCISIRLVTDVQKHVPRPCAGKVCYNDGVCIGNMTSALHGGHCVCREDYTGVDCSQEVDACASSPCKNGGSCETLPGTFHCYCAPGYDGRHCDHDYNECLYQPCKNGGTCHNIDNGFQCACPSDYTGQKCETHTDCAAMKSYQCWQIAFLHMCNGHFLVDDCARKRCEACQSDLGLNLIG